MSDDLLTTLFLAAGGREDLWQAVLSEGVHLRLGNDAPVLGRLAATAALGRFFSVVGSVGGQYREAWSLDGATLVETELVGSGRPGVRVPCAVIFRREGRPTVVDLRFYLDPTPLRARTGLNGGSNRAGDT